MTDTYTSPTHLTGKVAGQITSSGSIPDLGKKGTVWIDKGQQPDGSWLYWRKGYMPPVVTPPAASARIVQVGPEVFMQSASLAVGIGPVGSLGTMGTAPAGFITDTGAGYARLGMVALADGKAVSGDAVLKGTPIEGYVLGWRSGGKAKVLRCFEMEGTVQMTGSTDVADGVAVTRASVPGVALVQRARLDGDTLVLSVEVTNTGSATLADLRYMRMIDPDPSLDSNSFKTENRVVSTGTVTARTGAIVLSLSSPDPRATASIVPFAKAMSYDPAATPKPVGTVTAADDVLTLAVAVGDLPPASSATFAFSLGIAAA